jgi:hypothetical protein
MGTNYILSQFNMSKEEISSGSGQYIMFKRMPVGDV